MMKIGDLIERRMDNTLWLVIDTYFHHALCVSSRTGNKRWVFKGDWCDYEKR